MSEFRKVQKISTTLLVSIPSKMAEELGIDHGDTVRFDIIQNKLVLRPVKTEELLDLGLKKEGEVVSA